jgi:Ca2+-binding RTX toxin-like protein
MLGEGGDDVIEGRRGSDALYGGRGDNTLRGGSGGDYLGEDRASGLGANTAYGGAGTDLMRFTGNDDVYGGSADDRLVVPFSPGSHAVVDGGAGHNTLDTHLKNGPSGGWQHVLVDLTKGRVDADGDVSRFSGIFRILDLDLDGAASWTVNGTDGHDVITAAGGKSAPPVVVHGRGRADVIVTGSGDDTLYGGAGTDQAFAGGGTDSCFSIEGPVPPRGSTGCETSTP